MNWLRATLEAIADDASVEFAVSALHTGSGTTFEVRADTVWVAASTYKLVLAAVWIEAIARQEVNPLRRIVVHGPQMAPGPTGFSLFEDPVEVSYRDLVRSMLTVSDNAAAQFIWRDLGEDLVGETIARWGLRATRIAEPQELVTDGWPGRDHDIWAEQRPDMSAGEFDVKLLSLATAADLRGILQRIWTDEIANPTWCNWLRVTLGQQLFRHRLASGFAYDGVEVAGKTGTWGPYRHEAGVVTHPGESPVVISVLTRSARAAQEQPLAHAAVGRIAAEVVQALRQSPATLNP